MTFHEFTNRAAWRDAIELALRSALAADLLADDAAGPFVLFGDELGLTLASNVYGNANPSFWKTFRHEQPRLGENPGPTVVLNWPAIREDFGDPFHAATALTVHEVAHSFDFGSLRGVSIRDDEHEAMVGRVIREKLAVAAEFDNEQMERLGMSEMKFARRIVHIACRLMLAGWRVPLRFAYEWNGGFGPFVDALEEELKQFAASPIRDVDAVPAPESFVALWEAKGT